MAQSNKQGVNPIKSEDELIKQYKEVVFQIAGREIELDERMTRFLTTLQRQHERELMVARIDELKRLEELLDRLCNAGMSFEVEEYVEKYRKLIAIPLSAIEAERNKLKEAEL